MAFICVADIEASVMIALNLKELGIKTIIAKAINKKHGKILTKVGATEIVYPEEHMGKRIAELIIDTDIKEHLNFSDDFVLVEVKAPSTFWNNSLINLDVRNKYNINIVGIKKANKEFLPNPTANIIIEEGDILMIITDKKSVEAFNKLI